MRKTCAMLAAGLVLAAPSAFADGRIFSSVGGPVSAVSEFLRDSSHPDPEVAVDPVIPDQRALIVHRDGRETLVIETAFTGRGTQFAWVVPTPSVPRIEEVSPDLFRDLASETRPDLVSRVPDLGLAGLFVVGAFVLARHAGRRSRRTGLVLAAAAICACLVPGADDSRSRSVLTLASGVGLDLRFPMTRAEDPVVVKQRDIIGSYETLTLATRDPHELDLWLRTHDYLVPPGLDEVAAGYVHDGWVFNVMRLRRETDRTDTVRIHPLAFTFPAPEPVYPMRLTGVASGPVAVQLFVAGAHRAAADGFAVGHCSALSVDPFRVSGNGLVALHSGRFGQLVGDATVLTRLDRTFAADEMDSDVVVRSVDFAPTRRIAFSSRTATALSWNLAALVTIGLFVGLASAAGSSSRRVPHVPRWTTTIVVLLVGLNAGLLFAAFAPVVETTVAR